VTGRRPPEQRLKETDMKPLHIAMISVHSSPVGKLGTQDTGGMSVYIRELARQLGLRGHRVDIFTRAVEDGQAGNTRELSVNVRLIPLAAGAAGHAPKTALYPRLSAFFDALDRFRSQNAAAYDLIHSHYWLSGQVGAWARKAWGTPHITTFHTLGEVKRRACGAGSEPDVRITVERELSDTCDRILMTSAKEKDNLLRYYPARDESIAVVPCGVDLDLFQPLDKAQARRRIGAAHGDILALYVGRFAPEKGLERLLKATACLKSLPRLRLIIVGGDGNGDPDRQRMLKMSQACGLSERVTFMGRVDQADLPIFYSAADTLVIPSAYESFGMVALESLACGTPVVATRVGAMEELLRDPDAGRLASDLRPESLAAAMNRMPIGRRSQPVAPEAIRRTVLRYGWSRVAAEVLKVYRSSVESDLSLTVHLGHAVDLGHQHAKQACCGCGLLAMVEDGG
jgi:D-inositol-3-phosphate glycosyltransferase